MNNEKRYLLLRSEVWWYQRDLPKALYNQLGKIRRRVSLKTKDLAVAMMRRDVIARADDEYWNDLLGGIDRNSIEANYDRVILRARHMNIKYKPQNEMLASIAPDELLKRVEMLEGNVGRSKIATSAVLGAAKAPRHKCSEIIDVYVKDIMATQIRNKSKAQRHRWIVGHKRILNNFIAVCGDVVFTEINRENTLKYHEYFKNRVLSTNKGKRLSAGAANREIGTMQTIFKRYHEHFAIEQVGNSFSNLKFAKERSKPRPPFSTEWIRNLLEKPNLTSEMNKTARAIVFAMVETGLRPIEICNIRPETIFLDVATPYISIEPRDSSIDEPEGYELKTASSVRKIPLMGVSLAAFKVLKNGLGRYEGNSDLLSAAANKFFRGNGLMESEAHTIYSLRHSFKKRMVEAGVDEELRNILMGHADEKPEYGDGGSIEF